MITRYVQELGREVQLRPDTTDDQVFHETFVKQFHVPPEEIRPATVLDLGCNIGLTVAHFEALWPDAEIIGVDLSAENCVVARTNCRRSRILNFAVAATSGTQTYSGEEAWSFRLDPSGDRAVEVRTLDELTDLFDGNADFVKMDIAGAGGMARARRQSADRDPRHGRAASGGNRRNDGVPSRKGLQVSEARRALVGCLGEEGKPYRFARRESLTAG